jgi:methionine sulfoxide reductase heme-binding subunit
MTPVLALTSPDLWYTSRATGVVALVLLSAAMVLGIATTRRAASERWPRFAVSDLHRRVSLVAMVFVLLHVVTTVVDTFVPIGLVAAVVPFVSQYRPLWVGLGTVAFDLMLAVVVTSLLRGRIPAPSWRAVHWLVYLSWPIAVLHCLMVGTDTAFRWLLVIIALCVSAVVAAVVWRLVGTGLNRRSVPLVTAAPVSPAPTTRLVAGARRAPR